MSSPEKLKSTGEQPFNRLIAIVVSVALGVAVFWAADFFELGRLVESLEMKTYDIRAFLHNGQHGNLPANKPSDDIMIVKFDDPTLNNFEETYGTWPWPRDIHADMIQWMNEAGAKTIAYDIMFVAKKKGESRGDQKLIDAFYNNDNVYLSMNFDNNLSVLRTLGKELQPKDYKLIQPLGFDLNSEMISSNKLFRFNPTHFEVDDEAGFFTNESMTFTNYRGIIPELLAYQDRVAFVNHARDKDGISRSNPLLFRLVWADPDTSEAVPYRLEKKVEPWLNRHGRRMTEKWFDTDNTWVDEKGCKMASLSGTKKWGCREVFRTDFYPYLGLRLALDLLLPDKEKTKALLTKDGHLEFPGTNLSIPLNRDGSLLIKWYNINVEQMGLQEKQEDLRNYRLTLGRDEVEELKRVDEMLSWQTRQLEYIEKGFQAQPYEEVSAWKILKAIQDEKNGIVTKTNLKLKKSFKNKIIFVGTTAVSTYDIKTTAINKLMPGVVLQATVFDNIYQNTTYMRRLSDFENNLLTGLLCLVSALVIIRLRSALGGMGLVITLAGLYIMGAILLYQQMALWINIAAPMALMTVVTTLTYMVKYISKNRDYEQTYVMATTDSMTGLKNHRYFQEQLLEFIQYAERFNGKFSLLLIDIDYFKKFNDTYGHQAGDEVLRAVSLKLMNSVRSNDLVARYGGEEMTIILDKTNEQEALEVALKVVQAIAEEAYPIAEGVSKHVTISCGVATYPTHGTSASELIEFSDQGLYRAKESGRNKVGAQYEDEMSADETPPVKELENTSELEVEPLLPGDESASA